jgi:hypothetical protein
MQCQFEYATCPLQWPPELDTNFCAKHQDASNLKPCAKMTHNLVQYHFGMLDNALGTAFDCIPVSLWMGICIHLAV